MNIAGIEIEWLAGVAPRPYVFSGLSALLIATPPVTTSGPSNLNVGHQVIEGAGLASATIVTGQQSATVNVVIVDSDLADTPKST